MTRCGDFDNSILTTDASEVLKEEDKRLVDLEGILFLDPMIVREQHRH